MHLATVLFFIIVLIVRNGLFSTLFDERIGRNEVPLESIDDFNECDCHHEGSNWSSEECCLGFTSMVNENESTVAHKLIKRNVIIFSGHTLNSDLNDFVLNHSSPLRGSGSIIELTADEHLTESSPPDPKPERVILNFNANYYHLNNSSNTDTELQGIVFHWPKTKGDLYNCSFNFLELESYLKTWDVNGNDIMQAKVKDYIVVLINSTMSKYESTPSFSDKITTHSTILNGNRTDDALKIDSMNHSSESNAILNLFRNITTNNFFNRNTYFLNRFHFLIVKSTLTEAVTKPDPPDLLNGFNAIEDILKSVKQLNDKLNQLTYEGKEPDSNSDNSLSSKHPVMTIPSDSFANNNSGLSSPTMLPSGTTNISRKGSKWNIVKALFLPKRKNKTIASIETFRNETVFNVVDDIFSKSDKLEKSNNTNNRGKETPVIDSVFTILKNFYSRKSTNIPRVGIKTSLQNSENAIRNSARERNNEVLNMKRPIGIIHIDDTGTLHDVRDRDKDLNGVLFSEEATDQSSIPRKDDSNCANNTYCPSHDTKSIPNIMDSFRNWLMSPGRENDLPTENKKYHETQSISLVDSISQESHQEDPYHSELSSGSWEDKVSKPAPLHKNSDPTTDYSDHSDSTIEYAENNAGFPNDSYLFLIGYKNKTYAKSESKWKNVLQFLHALKLNPYHRNEHKNYSQTKNMVASEILSNAPSLVQVTSNSSECYMPPPAIRIPENLMPEALEADQPNLTELLFSPDYYDNFGNDA